MATFAAINAGQESTVDVRGEYEEDRDNGIVRRMSMNMMKKKSKMMMVMMTPKMMIATRVIVSDGDGDVDG